MKMIVFNKNKYIEQIKHDGIGATDPYADKKIELLLEDYIVNTQYKKSRIIDAILNISRDYFKGLPLDITKAKLDDMYQIVRKRVKEYGSKEIEEKTITLYHSEMAKIADLEDDRLMRLAFASLVLHKFCGQYKEDGKTKYHTSVYECNSDIYRIAKLDNLSGTAKDKLWRELSDRGYIKFYIKDNGAYRYNHKDLVKILFVIPYNVDIQKDKAGEQVFMQVTNYDDILLYLRYYLRDRSVGLCADCGCPIVITSNSKCYCSDCAKKRINLSKKSYAEKKII